MAIRGVVTLATELGREIPDLVTQARRYVHLDPSRHGPVIEESLATLLDRLALSMSLGKPVALATWGERESKRLGNVIVADLLGAARLAILDFAKPKRVDQQYFRSSLDTYCRVVEATLADARGNQPDDVASTQVRQTHATQALLAMLWERDFDTESHCEATAKWVRRLAPVLEMRDDSTDFLALCALLHDVGKVAVPDAVLNKPGPLDEAEWKLMRDHAAAGARILNQVPSLQRCAIVVRAHHERFDGTGYPDRLAGTSIPFEARVIAVADAFHAMISERPFREPVAPRRALEMLVEGRGSQWDPQIVDAMLSVVNRPSTNRLTSTANQTVAKSALG